VDWGAFDVSRKEKVRQVVDETGCAESTAIGYLEAEEWIVWEAVESLKVDRRGGVAGE